MAERRQLPDGSSRLALGLGERASQPHDLGLANSAMAGESVDRLTLAPSPRRFRPFARPAIIARSMHATIVKRVDDPGRDGRELARDRGDRGLVVRSMPSLTWARPM